MNREAKFKGLRTDGKGWVYGSLIITETGQCYIFNYHFIPAISCPSDKFIEVIPESVGQYTGLKDKKLVEIYEGDILKSETSLIKCTDNTIVPNSNHTNWYLVEYNTDIKINTWQVRRIKTTRLKDFGLGHTSTYLYIYSENAEIIGNIHENKNLLK